VATARINLADMPDFDLGGLRISPAHRLVGENGEQKELEPKVVQVLVALASARPQVVSRDRLIEQCWDGRIVGDDALNRCIVALRHLAKQFSPEPFAIETVTRVGYCLLERSSDSTEARPSRRRKRGAAVAALLALLLVAIGLAVALPRLWTANGQPASIAVLPFRNLSAGDSYFAEGISEEILDRLSREPALRVAGRASSGQFGPDSDVRDVARRLNVDYVLEGSVRAQGVRVRVNADLIRASDRARLWSESYDGTINDIFAIQTEIGQRVAGGIRRQFVHSPARKVNGEAYALYLNARGLLRSYNPENGQEAQRLLRQALSVDPKFAAAWSSLAEALLFDGATKGNEGMIAIVPQARDAARRALQLDPNDSGAHAILAELLGLDTPEAIAERRRAGELAARTDEGQMWLTNAFAASGRWGEQSAAIRRARDLDPVASGPWRSSIDERAIMGDRTGAERAVRRGFADDAAIQNFALARVAWFVGDFSEAARRWSDLANGQSQWARPSKLSLENALLMLNLSKNLPSRPPRPSVGQARSTPVRVWMTSAPSASEWQKRNRSSAAELVYRDENVIAAKLMLNAGRARELVATYESPTGLLGLRASEPIGTCFLQNAAILVVALRDVGRYEEADAILRSLDATIRAAYGRGPVPLWFDDDAAGIWVLQGKVDMAADALDRALRRGSAHATHTDLLRLRDEPAFRGARGNPRFESVLAKYEAHFARERAETARALHIAV
jgi:TolB-like protein/DNA-binding winged helix-turn-helix (wHTH) protein/tetratricopeptide (TPR) repeat protein